MNLGVWVLGAGAWIVAFWAGHALAQREPPIRVVILMTVAVALQIWAMM